MLVVDASVIVKAIVAEAGSDAATALVAGDPDLIVPAHCYAEVAETLVRKKRLGQASADQIATAMPLLFMTFRQVPLDNLLGPAVNIAESAGTSVYDALYIALAASEQCPFITADLKLVARMRDTEHAALLRALV